MICMFFCQIEIRNLLSIRLSGLCFLYVYFGLGWAGWCAYTWLPFPLPGWILGWVCMAMDQ